MNRPDTDYKCSKFRLEQYSLQRGYLLIFDLRKLKGEAGKVDEVKVKIGNREKNIVEVYC